MEVTPATCYPRVGNLPIDYQQQLVRREFNIEYK